MPRFPVAFGKRRSTADNLEHVAVAEPSFRVLERAEVVGGKSFDGGARLSARMSHMASASLSDPHDDDNIFADMKTNRGSRSSHATSKTALTDSSSRHSAASTAPSSADLAGHEDLRVAAKKPGADLPVPPIPKSSPSSFLKAAGRSFSFGGQKKQLPPTPSVDELPRVNHIQPETPQPPAGRARATTASTSATVTPPKVDDDFSLDLGGDFGKMLLGNDKRASVLTMTEVQNSRQALAPRSLTGSRFNQPSPIHIDRSSNIEASPYSWTSHHSNDQLLSSPLHASPNENVPPPVPRHGSTTNGKRPTTSPEVAMKSSVHASQMFNDDADEEEDTVLLRESLTAVNRFMSAGKSATGTSSRYRRNEDTLHSSRETSREIRPSMMESHGEDNLFENSLASASRLVHRYVSRKPTPPKNKVMTPAQFERYRKDKERRDMARVDTIADSEMLRDSPDDEDDEDEDHYEDDEDDMEKAKMQAKQRRKQEAHMAVYRQQMMKVTGEANPRTSFQLSLSTPNLPTVSQVTNIGADKAENSDEDEEVPLAILAAHGFPNKNRPPTRLSTMMSNPNLRASQQPSYQRPGSAAGEQAAGGSQRLPAFARNLPQDPYLGSNLVRNSVRESFALGGGSPAPAQLGAPVPPGGLIGVIANEERSRAMRRGSPHLDNQHSMPPMGPTGFDPIGGIPPQMMYQNMQSAAALSPGDQAQIQMTQQMQQFMQMQMQFMQMMAGQGGNAHVNGNMPVQSMGHLGAMGGPEMMRHSFVGTDTMLDLPRGDAHMRTMSMVQPSSASWIQPPPNPSYAPSIHIQGGGYAPSIAPSERSNIGLPGRYRPVSHVPPPLPTGPGHLRKSSTMSGALGGWSDKPQPRISITKSGNASDDDEEEGWEAMKAKREKKKSMWKLRKSTVGGDIRELIS